MVEFGLSVSYFEGGHRGIQIGEWRECQMDVGCAEEGVACAGGDECGNHEGEDAACKGEQGYIQRPMRTTSHPPARHIMIASINYLFHEAEYLTEAEA